MPMRESAKAGRCSLCGETIYVGELAYFVFGRSCCYGCIDRSAYVADGSGNLFFESSGEHLFDNDCGECRKEGKT